MKANTIKSNTGKSSAKYALLAVGMTWLLAMGAVQAGTVYNINFDHTPTGPNPYVTNTNETMPSGISSAMLNNTTMEIPGTAGPQGGNVLSQPLDAKWPNLQGYRFGAANDYSGTNGPTISNTYTLEFLAKPHFGPGTGGGGFGLATESSLFSSVDQDKDVYFGNISLFVNQTNGRITFEASKYPGDNLSLTNYSLSSDNWYHIAAVVEGGTNCTLFVNYQSLGSTTLSGGTNIYLPGYFTVGGSYKEVQRNWQGEMDAFAISDTALAPGSFVLPIPEPNQVALIVASGLLFAVFSGIAKRCYRK